jgi:23S rRNA (uridine2552-2'-O)-methyltransferase
MTKKPPSTPIIAGQRDLTVRVKTARGRKTSSTRWLQRQLNDPYVSQAKRDGYRSRAAYKLIELDDKFGLLKQGYNVVDLGAAPGGWSQVSAKRVQSSAKNPSVVAVDILDMPSIAGVTFLQCDMNDEDAPARIHAILNDRVNIVLSDLAPNTTGHPPTDHMRIILLCELAYTLALEILSVGGAFICKVRQGGTEVEMLTDMKRRFEKVAHFKPQSSRKESPETYVVAMGLRAGMQEVYGE